MTAPLWWCGACGCELPSKDGTITIAPCHCGAVMGQTFKPVVSLPKSDKCPPAVDPARSGIFKN